MNDTQAAIRATLGFLRRRIWMILATVLVLGGIASLVAFTLKPIYTATAMVLVDTSKKDLLQQDPAPEDFMSASARVDGDVQLAQSTQTLLRAIHDGNLTDYDDFKYYVTWQEQLLNFLKIKPISIPDADTQLRTVINDLRDAIRIQRLGATYIITISAQSPSPNTAAKIANAVANAYIQNQVDSKINAALTASKTIEAQIPQASSSVSSSEAALDKFYTDSLPSLAASSGNASLASLAQQLSSSTANKAKLTSLIAAANTSIENGDWDSLASNLKSETIDRLNSQRSALQQSLSGATDPTIVNNLRRQLTSLNTQLEQAAKSSVAGLQSQVSSDDAQLQTVRAQIGDAIKTTNLPPDLITRLYTLQQDQNNATDNFRLLLARRTSLQVNANLQLPDSRIVSPATSPNAPSFPNLKLILPVAALASLAIGIGLAFIYENYLGGFTSEQQLEAVLEAPVITAIPRQRSARQGRQTSSLSDLVMTAPLSLYSETIRRIRVRLDLALHNLEIRHPNLRGRGAVVMLTSTAPGEGKSTTALALARAFASTGRPTLLIDCDFRKPSLHRHVGSEPSMDMINYLGSDYEQFDVMTLAVPDPLSPARIVLGGRHSEAATDQIVGSDPFYRLIDEAAKAFDVVILDTPPIGPVIDGIYLAQYADVIAFVVKASSTAQPDVRKAFRALSQAKREEVEIALVLNQHDEPHSAYYSRYRGYYAT